MRRKSTIIVVICACVVLILVGLACGVIFFGKVVVNAERKAKLVVVKSQVVAMQAAMKNFHADHGTYPTGTADEILETLQGANTRGENPLKVRYLELPTTGKGKPLDPWKVTYHLLPAAPGSMPVFFSSGPDRMVDTGKTPADDIHP